MKPPVLPQRPTVLDPMRARPEPWFVGSGTGLMIGVVALCAVLILLRGVTLVWLAEEVWRRWIVPSLHPEPPSRPKPLPRRAVPPPDPAKAGQPLRGNPGAAFDADSYPVEALRAGEQGRVVARLSVDASGTPTGCSIRVSSRSRHLDQATCAIAMARIRFDPPRDRHGVAVSSTFTLPVRWVLPDG